MTEKTDFGFQQIPLQDKTHKVGEVFSSVAEKYDLMNDLMSLGIHRWWKQRAITSGGFRAGYKVLDLAGGSGDLTARISPLVGEQGQVYLADINADMLRIGRNRLLDQGLYRNVQIIRVNAESLPFIENYFDRVIIGFGLRNVTDKPAALAAIYRVLKPGGKILVLEFSKPAIKGLDKIYDLYSFNVIPKLGEWICHDKASYQYLVESIRVHPDQEQLKLLMEQSGCEDVIYHNLAGGIVALHMGFKY